ncbi:MAG: hypothetical protein JSU87_16165 [Gemmatimonadota bacterium]|nr:MAG: hypothetical protein JSU87_16165 [Gemmatimonadota bacterium]
MVRCAGTCVILTALACGACGGQREGDEMPAMLRQRFQTEMKMILRDVRLAEEQALALEGSYLGLDELRGRYMNRSLPEAYSVNLDSVTADGFVAEVMHRASGLSCRLAVGERRAGVPRCD